MPVGSLGTARAVVLAVALSTLVAIAWLSDRDWRDIARSRDESKRAMEATQITEQLLGLVRDAETGQRGFLLTGKDEYLAPYNRALSLVETEIAQLRRLLAVDLQQVERLNQLERMIEEKLNELNQTIETYDRKGEAAALAIVATNRGEELMGRIRALSQEIEAAAGERAAMWRAKGVVDSSHARLVTLAGCAVLLVILAAGFVINERSYKQRENLISRLDAAHRESAEVRDLLRTTLYSIADGVITTDARGNVQMMNSTAERMTGIRESAARGKPVEEIFQTVAYGSRPAPPNAARSALKGEAAPAAHTPVRLRPVAGEERFIEAGAAAIRESSGAVRGAVLVFRDVTGRMEDEEKLRQTAKLESLGVLAGGIAHDFNNLLVGMMGAASMLEEYLPPNAEGRDLLDMVQRSAERAARLTNQMLAYSGRGGFVIRSIDLSREVEELAPLLQVSMPKNVELRLATGHGLPHIDADSVQLQQLVMNLAINGAEAVGENYGHVEISTSAWRVTENSVADVMGEPLPAGWYVVLSVSDTGHGMDEATRARIFDPFFTTKFTGRGLGLAAVLGIVKGHNGAIEVESAPGEGAAFRVYFPASSVTGQAAA